MNSKFFIFLFLSLIVMMTSCSKDEAKDPNEVTNDRLVKNTWVVRSFTADGVEVMKVLYNDFEMRYTKEDKNNGNARWRTINLFGQASNDESKYTIRNQGKEIDLDGDIFEITVDDSKLLLTGSVGGERWVIDARK